MKKKVVWLLFSCLMVAILLLASCAPAVVEEKKVAPPVKEEEKVAPPVKEKVVAPPEKEMVKDSLGRLVEKPRYGGVLRVIATEGLPTGFDPLYSEWRAWHIYLVNEDLLVGDWARGLTGTGEASYFYVWRPPARLEVGLLAESWEMTEPGTFIFHIRKGVHFQDKPPANGREMNANDVVFSIIRLYKGATFWRFSYGAFTNMEKLEESIYATDKWTVVMKTIPEKVGPSFENFASNVMIFPPEAIEKYGDLKDWKNAVGTGPFMLTDFVAGSSMTLERNPNYWGKHALHPEDSMPYLDGIKFLEIPDRSTRAAALRTGKVDHYKDVWWEDAQSLMKTNPELKRVKILVGSYGMFMRQDVKPFDDIRVRRALMMAVDQPAIRDAYYGGNAELLTYPVLPVPDNADVYVPLAELPESTRELYEYHPDKARQLLAEAGYPNGFKTEVVLKATDVDLVSIVKDYWAKVGVDLKLDVKESGQYTSIYNGRMYKEGVYGSVSTTPWQWSGVKPGYGVNKAFVDNPVINDIIDRVGAAFFDDPKRRQLVKEAVPYIVSQANWVELPGPYQYTMWQPWVKEYSGEYTQGKMGYYRFARNVWLDQELKKAMGR